MPLHLNALSKDPPNEAGESDIYLLPAISAIHLRAWLGTTLYRTIYPGPPSTHPGIIESNVVRHKKALLEDPDYRITSLVGCHDPEVGEEWKVVAFVKYALFDHEARKGREKGMQEEPRVWPEGTHVGVIDYFYPRLLEGRERWGEKLGKYVFVDILATDPEWQRMGAGKMLMESVIEEADRLGWPCFLEGSEEGMKLYESLGFVKQEAILVDLARWEGGGDKGEGWRGEGAKEGEGEGWYRLTRMTRPAKGER